MHNSNHQLALDEIVDLQQQSLSVSYDAYPVKVSQDVLDRSLIESFIRQVNQRGRITLGDDFLTNLVKLKLIRDDRVHLPRTFCLAIMTLVYALAVLNLPQL